MKGPTPGPKKFLEGLGEGRAHLTRHQGLLSRPWEMGWGISLLEELALAKGQK